VRRVESLCSHEDCGRDGRWDPCFDVGHSEEDLFHG